MKNLIIQHFVPAKAGLDPVRKMEDDIPMLVKKSSENVQEYAKRFNSDYKMLSGSPFRKNLSYKCQKCAIINEEYDEYDIVVALDTDVFFTKKCNENIFFEKGIAYMGETQKRQILSLASNIINLGFVSNDTSFWSGAVYVMDRPLRKKLRNVLENTKNIENALIKFDTFFKVWDEGIFHSLCHLAGIGKVSLDQKWNYDSSLPNLEKANLIHIRHRPKTRDENYSDLKENGII
jgi:hypothetical protein